MAVESHLENKCFSLQPVSLKQVVRQSIPMKGEKSQFNTFLCRDRPFQVPSNPPSDCVICEKQQQKKKKTPKELRLYYQGDFLSFYYKLI